MTARTLARRGVRRPVLITSPYSGRTVVVVAAQECGAHVLVTAADGRQFPVDAGQRVRTR